MQSKRLVNPKHEWCRHRAESHTDPLEGDRAKDLASQTGERALARFDRLRRNHNRSEYGSKSFGQAEVRVAIDTAKAIQAACSKLS